MSRKHFNDETTSLINNIEYEIEEENARHRERIKVLNKRISELRSECHHEETTYWPDPSGNNDSHYTCNICGLEQK